MSVCPQCGGLLPKTVLRGLCPRCTVHACLESAEPIEPAAEDRPRESEVPAGAGRSGSTPDRFFGGYELLEELGRGGMAVVNRAIDTPNDLYRNDGNGNRWILLRLVGTVSNRSAIGAKVRAQTTIWGQSVQQMREISGTPYTGDLRAHFGLGDATNVTTLRIEWPSGIVQELQNVSANQILTITEPARLVPLGPREFQIRCWKGMQFEVENSHDLKTWDSLGTVTNLTGTLTFQDAQGDPGTACCFYRVVSR